MNPFETYSGSYFGRERRFCFPETEQELIAYLMQLDPFQSVLWNKPHHGCGWLQE